MKIEHYGFGEIVVDGIKYERDLIIFPDRIKENWWRKEGHSLCMEDLREVIEYKPEILIIGTGYSGVMKVPENLIGELEKKGIKVQVLLTGDVVKAFNKYVFQNKKVVCALHLTC